MSWLLCLIYCGSQVLGLVKQHTTLQFMIEKACTQAQTRNATKTAKWGKCSGALKFWVVDTWINYINNLNTSSFFIMNTVSGNMFLTILTYLYMLL